MLLRWAAGSRSTYCYARFGLQRLDWFIYESMDQIALYVSNWDELCIAPK